MKHLTAEEQVMVEDIDGKAKYALAAHDIVEGE